MYLYFQLQWCHTTSTTSTTSMVEGGAVDIRGQAGCGVDGLAELSGNHDQLLVNQTRPSHNAGGRRSRRFNGAFPIRIASTTQ